MTALGAVSPRTPALLLVVSMALACSLALLAPTPARALEGKVLGDVVVPKGETRESVSTAYGNVLVEGDVEEDVRSGFGNIDVEGAVGGDVKAGFGDIRVNSRVGEDVEAGYGNIELGPGAEVEGDVFVGGGAVRDHRGAEVLGQVHTGMPGMMGDEDSLSAQVYSGVVGWVVVALGLAAATVLVAVLAPGPLKSSVRSLESWPGRSLLVGAGSFPAMVVGSILLAFTGVGIILLFLAWPAYLLLGVFGLVVGVYLIGRRLMLATGRYRAGDALAAVLGALIVSAVCRVPYLAVPVLGVLASLGTGGAVLALLSRRRRTPRVAYESYEEYAQARHDT